MHKVYNYPYGTLHNEKDDTGRIYIYTHTHTYRHIYIYIYHTAIISMSTYLETYEKAILCHSLCRNQV